MSIAASNAAQNAATTVDIGVFIPIANNGWIISKASPQYKPTFLLNKQIVQRAEQYGLEFALSMVKLRGFGGETEFWDYALESFTLMAGLAAVTDRIKLFASTAVLTLPPAIVARMATTIDSIAPGRFGINIVSGWSEAEYGQMGLWPGNDYFKYRYDYSTEYVQVMRELWSKGESEFKGRYFQMRDCKLRPLPSGHIPLVAAGQSERGMRFAAEHVEFNFIMGTGVNSPKAFSPANEVLVAAAATAGRDVGAYVLFMIIADETDAAAQSKWQSYREGSDMDALAYMGFEAGKDKDASGRSSAAYVNLPEGAVNMNMGTLVGSYATVAAMLDQVAEVPGTKGIMLTFDDFLIGLDQFGRYIQPLMKSRSARNRTHAEN